MSSLASAASLTLTCSNNNNTQHYDEDVPLAFQPKHTQQHVKQQDQQQVQQQKPLYACESLPLHPPRLPNTTHKYEIEGEKEKANNTNTSTIWVHSRTLHIFNPYYKQAHPYFTPLTLCTPFPPPPPQPLSSPPSPTTP